MNFRGHRETEHARNAEFHSAVPQSSTLQITVPRSGHSFATRPPPLVGRHSPLATRHSPLVTVFLALLSFTTALAQPIITDFSPTAGTVDDVINLNGTGFTSPALTVRFWNGMPATI